MSDTQLTMIIGFGGMIANQFFQAWRTRQDLQARALKLAEKTAQDHAELKDELRQNTELTIKGNDIKSDILNTQKDVIEIQKKLIKESQ